MTEVYVSGRQVGVRWDGFGPVHVLDRDGAVVEQFRPPADSVEMCMNGDSLDAVLESAVERLREAGKVQKLSAKKIQALVDAIRSVEA